MFDLIIENKYKQQLRLSQNESNYQILSIEGLSGIKR